MNLTQNDITVKKPLVWLEINKKNLLYNVKQMKKLCGNKKIMAVLKANAYGLGGTGVAKIIKDQVEAFGVVGINEALSLRNAGIRKPIINLGIYSSDDAEQYIRKKISPNIFTYSALKNFENTTKKYNKMARVWIKVDTGLNRLGTSYQEASSFIRSVSDSEYLKIEGVYSTLGEDQEYDKKQFERFYLVKEKCEKLGIRVPVWSIASSQACFMYPEYGMDMLRLGISLLGYYPSKEAKNINRAKLKPTASFKTKVACVKELNKGETVFYRKKYIAQQKTRIAVLLPGYSYGLDPRLVEKAKVLIRGKAFPLVGGISATNCFADIGTNEEIKTNDEVIIFGVQGNAEIKLEKICALLNQNEYEFLSRIPEKVQRIYV
ncbi:MAG: alanine racemase [Candidatus Magasanikbacteria bacterium]|nr:alanine racemase [Candidatus Magasanikbacteria bacterium]